MIRNCLYFKVSLIIYPRFILLHMLPAWAVQPARFFAAVESQIQGR